MTSRMREMGDQMRGRLPIYGATLESLSEALEGAGYEGYRAGQVMDWVYKKRVRGWEEMTNLPRELQQLLSERYTFDAATTVESSTSDDVTKKLLLRLGDGRLVETVLIRAPREGVGLERSRKTVCVSTQVGCAYACRFCASGLEGFERNLSAAEIVGQLMEVCRLEEPKSERPDPEVAPFNNIVVMGMGEPLANYDNLVAALEIVNADWGLRFGARRITVSTVGLVPQIRKLAAEPLQFRLAVSLHGATDEVRSRLVPVNRKYPLAELLPAARLFAQRHGPMLTLEYILIEEVNDTLEQARALARIAHDLPAHVNLIPYNTVEGLPWRRPSLPRQERFAQVLRAARVPVTVRREKGHEIEAACGQLRLRRERAEAGVTG